MASHHDEGTNDTNEYIDAGIITDPSILSSKRVVYIGGLADAVTIPMVRAALIPFGEIQTVDMPMDYVNGKHRGFAFVEYTDADDASEAIFNMDGAELAGKTISASVAQANQLRRLNNRGNGDAMGHSSTEAVWKSDEWFQNQVSGDPNATSKQLENQRERDTDARTLQQA